MTKNRLRGASRRVFHRFFFLTLIKRQDRNFDNFPEAPPSRIFVYITIKAQAKNFSLLLEAPPSTIFVMEMKLTPLKEIQVI